MDYYGQLSLSSQDRREDIITAREDATEIVKVTFIDVFKL